MIPPRTLRRFSTLQLWMCIPVLLGSSASSQKLLHNSRGELLKTDQLGLHERWCRKKKAREKCLVSVIRDDIMITVRGKKWEKNAVDKLRVFLEVRFSWNKFWSGEKLPLASSSRPVGRQIVSKNKKSPLFCANIYYTFSPDRFLRLISQKREIINFSWKGEGKNPRGTRLKPSEREARLRCLCRQPNA